MRRQLRRSSFALIAILIVQAVASGVSAATPKSPSISSVASATYDGNNSRTGYTTNTSITPANVGGLTQRWRTSVDCSHLGSTDRQRWGRVLGRLERHHARNQTVVRQANLVDVSGQNAETAGLHLWARHPRHCEYGHDRHPQRPEGVVGRRWCRATCRTERLERHHHLADATPYGARRLGLESPLLYKGSIYVGVSSFQGCPDQFGRIVRVNAATGALQKAINFASSCRPSARDPVPGRRPRSTRLRTRSSSTPPTTCANLRTKTAFSNWILRHWP